MVSDEATGSPGDAIQLSGLHAKCYVSDVGSNTLIWSGSANATDAAFSRNVEFLVQLSGPKNVCGVDRLLTGNKDSAGFRDILTEADSLLAQAVPPEDDIRGPGGGLWRRAARGRRATSSRSRSSPAVSTSTWSWSAPRKAPSACGCEGPMLADDAVGRPGR